MYTYFVSLVCVIECPRPLQPSKHGLDDAVPEWSVIPTDADNAGYERDWWVRGRVLPVLLRGDFTSARHFFLFATPASAIERTPESATI